MNDTPTPRTDDSETRVRKNGFSSLIEYCYANDMAKLETELTAARSEIAQIKAILANPVAVHSNLLRGTIAWTPEHLRHILGDYSELTAVTEQRDKLLEQQEQWRLSSVCRELTDQRDRLAEALKEYREALSDGPENCSYKMYEAVDEFAEKALQSLTPNEP